VTVKRPVSGSLAWAFFSIIALSVLTSTVALLTLASSQRDAEAINIAGSLRMQSYRLGYEMQRNSPSLAAHRESWQQTLSAPALQKLNRWYVPDNVKRATSSCMAWQEMDARIARGDSAWYQTILRILSAALMPLCSPSSTTPNIKFRRSPCSRWLALSGSCC
jgi:two-component system nitrate/nitrite sensor histidine kinase NarQ